MKKQWLGAVPVILSAFFFVASAVASPPVIAVSFPGSVLFFDYQKKGMEEAADKYNLSLLFEQAEWNAQHQLTQIEQFIQKKVDAILLCAVDNEKVLPAVDMANEAGIPLITFTNVLGNSPDGALDGVITFVGTHEVKLGRLLGEMAEKMIGNSAADIVLIEGAENTAPQKMRSQGIYEIVAGHSNWKIIYRKAIEGWTKEGAAAAMEDFLETGQPVDLVICHWHAAAVAVADTLEQMGYKDKLPIVTLEFSRELKPYILQGKVDMTSNYSVSSVGFTAVEAACQYLAGEKLPPFIEAEVITVSKENAGVQIPMF
ncbi:MAG: sugar ABC transporter substrate-binding protein [Desulfobacter sp.]|nr:MAG: sugar ABC transporter substrate-binding protein [Desulfobacter sp.]